jgi:hypothetical protein
MKSSNTLKTSLYSALAAVFIPVLFLLYSIRQFNMSGWDHATATKWGGVLAVTIFVFTYALGGFYFIGQLLRDTKPFNNWKFRVYNVVGLGAFALIAMSLLSVYAFISQKNFDLFFLLRGWTICFMVMSILCVPSAEIWLYLNKKANS